MAKKQSYGKPELQLITAYDVILASPQTEGDLENLGPWDETEA